MTHRVLSLKYRPQIFDELTGQEHVILSLKGAIKSNRIGHAFLFAGPRGVGKTTTARIFAKSINCDDGPTVEPCQECQSCKEITLGRSIDVVEIDGASNRGIDEIRSLREGVKYSPIHGRYKIYIIDEVHMLTQEAFNALLKTLEEPPPKVIFIFATTNPTKVPATILSRCQRFVFKRLSLKEITSRLKAITEIERIQITEKALHYIALRADGSIRDGESILEQLTSFVEENITEKDVFQLIGFLGNNFYADLLKYITMNDLSQVIATLNKGIEDGADPVEIYRGFVHYVRAMLLAKAKLAKEYLELSDDEIEILQGFKLDEFCIIRILETCLKFEDTIKRSINIRIALELLFSQLALAFKQEPDNTGKTNRKGKSTKSLTQSRRKTIKDELVGQLQNKNPKLAGIIQQTEISKSGKKVVLMVENDFLQKELERSHKLLTDLLKKVIDPGIEVRTLVNRKKPEESELIENIKGMFDGEEVR